jgi:hypothetical protein
MSNIGQIIALGAQLLLTSPHYVQAQYDSRFGYPCPPNLITCRLNWQGEPPRVFEEPRLHEQPRLTPPPSRDAERNAIRGQIERYCAKYPDDKECQPPQK